MRTSKGVGINKLSKWDLMKMNKDLMAGWKSSPLSSLIKRIVLFKRKLYQKDNISNKPKCNLAFHLNAKIKK